jgi:hypothetical protein
MEDVNQVRQLRLPRQVEAQRLVQLRARLASDVADMEAKTAPEAEFSMLAMAMVCAFKSAVGL